MKTIEDKIKQFVIRWGQTGMIDNDFENELRQLLEEYKNQGMPTDDKLLLTFAQYFIESSPPGCRFTEEEIVRKFKKSERYTKGYESFD